MPIRGIRGAVDCSANTRAEISRKTRMLLRAMVDANRVKRDRIACAIFTVTPDLNAEFPASVARELGWSTVPMICAQEIGKPKAMKRVIRVLLLVESSVPPKKIDHRYLGRTKALRPDLEKKQASRKTRRKR